MSGNNRMRAALAGLATVAVMGSGIALAPSADAATTIKAKAYATAKDQRGDPYKWGATGPNAFDCSGLVYYSYKKNGKYLKYKSQGKWHTARTAQQQYWASNKVKAKDRSRGDLVFFYGSSGVYHVGIYADHGYMWHAPYTGAKVRREKIWTSKVKYGRIN